MTVHPLAPPWLAVPEDLNELPSGLWPQNVRRAQDGAVEVAGVTVTELARQFGTPLYVLDEDDLRARAVRVRAALVSAFAPLGSTVSVYYAGKAFLCGAVARWVSEAGLGVDVASGGELAVALAAGVEPASIGFHGNNKSAAEIRRAVVARVGAIVLDSPLEVERVARIAREEGLVQRVKLRVNSGVHASTHDFLATSHEDQKFGVTWDECPAIVARVRELPELEFAGLHCHIGSQIFGSDGFAESASRLIGMYAQLLRTGPVPEINLGGGFGIAYTTADDPEPIEEIADGIARAVARECEAHHVPVPSVAFEPGRLIVGPTTFTLYEVGMIKPVTIGTGAEQATRTYVSVDGGMSDNARPALYGAEYSVRLASRASSADASLVRIAGKHCESGDIIVNADYLPGDVSPGDLVAVPATGAYCWSLSSNYNYLTRPPVVAVTHGTARLIVRGETEQDLLARDVELSTERGTHA